MSDRRGYTVQLQEKFDKAKRIKALKDGAKDYDTPCQNCDALPTVHPTALCGPCCFGEAETAGGNW